MRAAPGHRGSNFDVLRLCAASAVVGSHAVLVTAGGTWWIAHAGGLFDQVGSDAVAVFFVVSGILVTESWRRDPAFRRYLARRGLRLLPALLVVVAVSALVVGALASRLTPASYLSTPGAWAYLLNATMVLQPYHLPGVFTHLPEADMVNGSLWTLRYEFLCYLVVPLVVALVTVTRRRATVLAIAAATALLASASLEMGWDWTVVPIFKLTSYFVAGMCIQMYVPKVRFDGRLAVLAAAAFIVLSQYPPLFPLSVVALAYAVGYFGLAARPVGRRLVALGDASYGIYLWGFVVEQLVVLAAGPQISAAGVFAIAMPITWTIGILSWRLIEKPALRFKPRAQVSASAAPRQLAPEAA